MSFTQSLSSVFRQYFVFSGRARRSEYWWFALFQLIVALVLAIILPVLYVIYIVATLLPSLAVLVRRLHDTGRPAWWLLLAIIPFGSLVLLIFTVLDGERGENKYGPDPLLRSPTDAFFEGIVRAQSSQGGARFCISCGSALESGANFCRSCGTAV